MELIITTQDKLTQLVTEAVSRALKVTKTVSDDKPDRINLNEAIELTELSKSKLYKLTMQGEIPFSKFGNRLIFSRKELIHWMDQRTIPQASIKKEVADNLRKQVCKKKGISQ